jgi:NADPH:quinone reductase-like Zn-dependent oxidoreductase/SAM-dependent methyltransferase/NADP-dependent 3-hydroxy acid dehydrogenase YdfG
MQEVGQLYDNLVTNQPIIQRPNVPFYSTVFAQQLHKAEDFGAHYWRLNMESPVWFYQGFKSLLQSEIGKDAIYLEIGPHSALAGPITQIYRAQNAYNPYLSVLSRGSNAVVTFLSCVGELWSRGVNIEPPLPTITAKALHDLPPYPWHHTESWWSESRPMKASRFHKFPSHELLGARAIESSDLEPLWRNVLRLSDVAWLRDHCVGPDIVFPAAGYIAMVGHAVWQMTELKDFTVRNMSFKTAMVLKDNMSTEIITRLQPQRLTDSLNSSFFEFSIQSYTGSVWIQHCSGLVAGGQSSPGPEPTATSYGRVVASKRWYRAMSRAGLRYGPHFTGLNEITASVSENAASAKVQDNRDSNSPYVLHPTTMDLILQSALVAMHQGQPRYLQQSGLPTFIEKMYIKGGTRGQSIHMNTTAQKQKIHSHGVDSDTLVFFLNGLEFSAPEMEDTQQEEHSETAQLVWKPDIRFVDPATLVKPAQQAELLSTNPLVERIFLLCIIDLADDIKDCPTVPHLDLYRTWMSKQLVQAQTNGYPLVPDAKDLLDLSACDRKELIHSLVASHTEGTMIAGSRILFLCYRHMSDIFKGRTSPLELMRRGGLLGQYYDCLQDKHDYKEFLQLLGHLRPHMNVLEIGAGTGGLTAKVLDFLQSDSGEELYQEYTYTDISSGFFVDAQERFRGRPRIRYDVLDISKDPIKQGFPEGHYDLIIASNILHATPLLTETLKHTRRLLKSDGRLLLQELCPVSNWTNFIFGLFPGWWLGKDDGRPDEPYISPKDWDTRLRAAGFAGVDASALDAEHPYQINTMLVATPAPISYSKMVTLLSLDPSHEAVDRVHHRLSADGYEVDLISWGENLPSNQDIVILLDLEAPFFDHISQKNLSEFLQMVKDHSTSNFLWVTHSAQICSQNPRFAQVLGMARTLRSELGVSFATLEMQDFGPASAEPIYLLLQHIQQRVAEHNGISEFDPDQEFAWTNGAIHVGRMHWLSVSDALTKNSDFIERATLEIGRPGLLNTLHWASQPIKRLHADEVRIKTMSISMNFRELLLAMGVVPNDEGQEVAGTDSAGVVTAVGSSVANVSVGDRVMALSVEKTSYTTELQLPSHLCARIPDDCNFEDASTLPTVYLTVLRTLREKANLRKNQSVLIHSAAGGVGIAAINYAKWVGANIYATVSSSDKTAFLVDKMGVMRENIFYSRDNTFLDAVMEATCGRGVDVVLNSLSGEQLHTSWQCVAQGGSMIEIGKRDLLGRGQLAMSPFLANRSYIGVDIATLPSLEPEWVQEQLATIVDLYNEGALRPIRPIRTFPANEVEDAFRYLQKGQHIGKLVLQFSNSPDLAVVPKIPGMDLRADKAYLLVGGMRGIGASIARWMVSHGAKNLVFLSRSAGEKDEDRLLIRELSEMGCQALTFAGDVADLATVQRVVTSTAVPIAGVIQLAMVLADAGVMDMNLEKWNAAVRPKVDGTWNLHEALPTNLDFFVMASSLSGTFGNYGQSNYAAANTFLDAFAQFRQSKGLAASVIDLGVVDEIGFVSRNASVHRSMVQQMSPAISEQSLLNCFHLAIIRSCPSNETSKPFNLLKGFRSDNQLLHGLLSKVGVDKGQFMWQRDPRTALNHVHRRKDGSTPDDNEARDGGLKVFLCGVHDNPEILHDESSAHILAKEIARQVSVYTTRGGDEETNMALSLQDFGVDSLVSIELRNWWKQAFGADVTVLQLMNSGSFIDLGQKAVDQLKQRHLKV